MAHLSFHHGLMGCGKSSLALQSAYSYREAGYDVELFTGPSRDGRITSRSGLSAPARPLADLHESFMGTVDRIIVDEAQFLSRPDVDNLYLRALHYGTPIDCYGLLTNFRTDLFEGSKRLTELADVVQPVTTPVLCWVCGSPAKVNARILGGYIQRVGPSVMVGDLDGGEDSDGYRTLCYTHWHTGYKVTRGQRKL